jgi:hypothetical protein
MFPYGDMVAAELEAVPRLNAPVTNVTGTPMILLIVLMEQERQQ